MKVLVDTCVWSLAFRRSLPESSPEVEELSELIQEGRAAMVGPVRQEVLSGIRSEAQHSFLRQHLRAFTDLELTTPDFERAAECFTVCRQSGVQGSSIDSLLCAVAGRRGMPLFTTDADFERFARLLPFTLHQPRSLDA